MGTNNITVTTKAISHCKSKRLFQRFLGEKGFTLIELMLAVAIMGIVVPAVISLYTNVVKGFTKDDAQNQMKKINQETMLRLYMTLNRNKHLFSPASNAVSMVGRLDMTNCPPVTLTGTDNLFPTVVINGVLDPVANTTMTGSWGNMLLFLADEGRVVCSGAAVTNSTNNAVTVQFDTYRFYYYYLDRSPNLDSSLLGTGCPSRLVEWRSVPMVDYNQLKDFIGAGGDPATIAASAIKFLTSRTAPNQAITLAVDTSASDPSTILWSLVGNAIGSNVSTLKAGRDFAPAGAAPTKGFKYMTSMKGSLSGRTCRYGIAPNTAVKQYGNLSIPQYATANGNFPGGFEIGIVGSSGSRQVLVRQALAVEGNIGPPIGSDVSMVYTCRDIW